MKRGRSSGVACETWTLLFELFMVERPRLPSIAAEHGLTPAQCHALRLIEPGSSVPMGRLAAGLACDASNITGIVDRLEARGLIERRPGPHDRRVKELVLTASGTALRSAILQRLSEPPELMARLSAADQRALRAILRKVLAK